VSDEPTSRPLHLPPSNLYQLWPELIDWPTSFPIIRHDNREPIDVVRAAKAMIVALFALREYRLVDYNIMRKKILFVKVVEVTMAVSGQAVLGGVEADLLAAAQGENRDRGIRATVYGTIRRWFGSDTYDPWRYVNRAVMEWGVRYGAFKATEEGRYDGSGKAWTEWAVPPVAAGCWTMADALDQRWQRFIQAEPDLASELVRQVGLAIDSRERKEYHQ
jgi:hypothetical protein